MGRTVHEVFRIREVRNHRTGGTVVALNAPDMAPIAIPRSTFYDWYSRYQEGGIEALVDGKPRPRRIWNKIPDKIETAIVIWSLRSRTCRRVSSPSTSRTGHRLSALEGPWPDH